MRLGWLPLLSLVALGACAPRATRPEREERRPLGEGLASYYGPGFAGKRTASGERFDPEAFTAAHRSARFGTCLRVVNVANGRSVRVRVNDRGPFIEGRVIDVSVAAARALGMLEKGVARVRLYRCRDDAADATALPAALATG